MQIEDYFDFQSKNDIGIKGHRIGTESILYEYVHRDQTPEEIINRFPTLKLEQIYATILYIACIINKRLMAIFLNGLSMKIKCSISRLKILLQQ
jgi:uncharacterized protein (DUF433 family)